ncbi:MAG: Penicillin-binding protein 1A [Oceanospirillaceae bacterium UBA2001]|jgi:penicillin-binding protein 1A|nr:MAG: Penicillin-binding protein 1A [Oceanospirillaceae bacterium UBA2001]|tara:strand:- start:3812 stop:6325 length:2514 start_codon:yes stop_codon:yes gene_type:complete
MSLISRLFKWTFILGIVATIVILAVTWFYLVPRLPDVNSLRDYHLQTPLRVMSRDGKLISEFGEQRRIPLTIDQVPQLYIDALLSAEDENFYSHYGVDPKALLRAAVRMVQAGGKIQGGGSTITMQVARNYLLTLDQTFIRKFNEILLSFQIEQELSKKQILEMYFNKMFMGHRAYGIEAASHVYYGRSISELDLPQLAMLAGLYKAPSKYNPISNPTRSKIRRDWILGRMLKLNYIQQEQFEVAIVTPITARFHSLKPETSASYVAEMVRSELFDAFPIEDVYTGGYRVYTTIDSKLQDAAQLAVQTGLLAYDRRHGYRGVEKNHGPNLNAEEAEKLLNRTPVFGPLQPAIVRRVDEESAQLLLRYGQIITINFSDMSWVRPRLSINSLGRAPDNISQILSPGDQVRVRQADDDAKVWYLSQVPDAQGALIALDPKDGAMIALVGGFEYLHSKFNRATQALRQPGSNFKPIVYSAALEQDFTAATLINDAPVVFNDASLEGSWRPENYSGKFFGPTRLRKALYKSRNLVSIRILREIGIKSAINYATRFGFKPQQLPRNLSLALGSASVPPIDVATAYASFANQGYQVKPYFIERIEDSLGKVLYQAQPTTVCPNCDYIRHTDEVDLDQSEDTQTTVINDVAIVALDQALDQEDAQQNTELVRPVTHLPIAPRIMDERVNYIMHTILQDVVKKGTARKAKKLNRDDLAGKTGTTNDQKDAWFSGYVDAMVATAWVGFDQPATLGKNEFGSTAALPIWIDFMEIALKDVPQTQRQQPDDMVTIKIDEATGELARPGDASAVEEIFRAERTPKQMALPKTTGSDTSGKSQEAAPEQVF